MRKSVLFLVSTLVSTMSFAESVQDKNNLFKCVDSTELSLNAECLSQTIESNVKFKEFQSDFQMQIGDLGGNAMATMKFYPELMEIHIIAHDDEASSGALAKLDTEQSKDAYY
ncbi:pyridine nucleotide transhydrogenase [Planctobacterium marinum]|uniref:Uncharacterized protein n=1 Tax=Planctobacterium marinum TaxID=1631968 RepID=A0AA48HK71_9ALTE|nr:hypothetical protein MACH26_34620 [Planctobacterium marinum]